MLTAAQVLNAITSQTPTTGLVNFGAQIKETTDSRTLLQRFRKSGLFRLLRENGYEVDENMDQEKMISYAMAFEDKLDFSKVELSPDGFGGINVKKPASHLIEERAFDKKVQEEKKELQDMSRPELMKLAKEKGLPVSISMTSQDLISSITGTTSEVKLEQDAS